MARTSLFRRSAHKSTAVDGDRRKMNVVSSWHVIDSWFVAERWLSSTTTMAYKARQKTPLSVVPPAVLIVGHFGTLLSNPRHNPDFWLHCSATEVDNRLHVWRMASATPTYGYLPNCINQSTKTSLTD